MLNVLVKLNKGKGVKARQPVEYKDENGYECG